MSSDYYESLEYYCKLEGQNGYGLLREAKRYRRKEPKPWPVVTPAPARGR